MKQIDKSKRFIPPARLTNPTRPVNTTTTSTSPTGTSGSRWTVQRPPVWVLLPMRLFLGVTFVYAGIQKLTDPQYFNPSAIGYIGKQIMGFANKSPIHDFLVNIVVPHAMFFGALVAYGELAIGLGVLVGLLLRPAAFFGTLISLLFFLSASWRVFPYFYGSDIVFVFCWITMLIAGPVGSWLPALDILLVPRLLASASPQERERLARVSYFLLGVGKGAYVERNGGRERSGGSGANIARGVGRETSTSAPTIPDQVQRKLATANKPANYRGKQAVRRTQESRRNFLWGIATGGAGMLGLVWLVQTLHIFSQAANDTVPASSSTDSSGNGTSDNGSGLPNPTNTPSSSGTSGNPNFIAQVDTVPTNSAANFTIPSNGDPGILVHLSNGKFVAYDATCTHAGCPVDYDPSQQVLICPCHGAAFDPAKAAAAVQGPTDIPLTVVPISIDTTTGTISVSNS